MEDKYCNHAGTEEDPCECELEEDKDQLEEYDT